MTGRLTVGGTQVGGAVAGADDDDGSDEHAGRGAAMTEADYQRMDEAVEATIGKYPAETELQRGNPDPPPCTSTSSTRWPRTATRSTTPTSPTSSTSPAG